MYALYSAASILSISFEVGSIPQPHPQHLALLIGVLGSCYSCFHSPLYGIVVGIAEKTFQY